MNAMNLTQMASVREYQKYFNQAFNLSNAAANLTYASTQTVNGGLIICRNFRIDASVTITFSNPTTIICESFTNLGTISMSTVAENILAKHRMHAHLGQVPAFADVTYAAQLGVNSSSHGYYFRSRGWDDVGGAAWFPIALFRNPLLGMSGHGPTPGAVSLAFAKRGADSFNTANTIIGTGGNPGSFIEVFSRGDITNSGGVTASGAGGGLAAGGGGGGGIGFYSESKIVNSAALTANGGAGGANTASAGYGGGGGPHFGSGGDGPSNINAGTPYAAGGGGGGGGIFLTAPVIVNTGSLTVNGGAQGQVNQGAPSKAGIAIVEPYLRLWMPNEDDTTTDLRYSNTGT